MKNFVTTPKIKDSKVKATAKLFFRAKTICKQKSYYPDELHKSTWEVFCDQLYFIWKFGGLEKYYYL